MIDINALHIGSHVLIDGQRREVFGLGCGRVSYLPHPVSSISESVLAEDVEPIPITEELLAELGFEYTSHDFGMWWQKKIGKHNCEIDVRNDKWYVLVKGCDFVFDYLHELEQFLYLTTKTELIKSDI